MVTFQIGSDGNFSDIHNQFNTMISSERERAFLVAEMSVFREDISQKIR